MVPVCFISLNFMGDALYRSTVNNPRFTEYVAHSCKLLTTWYMIFFDCITSISFSTITGLLVGSRDCKSGLGILVIPVDAAVGTLNFNVAKIGYTGLVICM